MPESSMTPEIKKSPSKSTNAQLFAEAAVIAGWELTRRLGTRVEDPHGYFQKAKEHLGKGGSLLVAINHSAIGDVRLIGDVIEKELTSLDHIGAIIAINQFDEFADYQSPTGVSLKERIKADIEAYGRRAEYHLIDRARKRKGFELMTVVREKDKMQKPERYAQPSTATGGLTPEELTNLSTQRAREFITIPGNALMIAPEGQLNRDGVLTRADAGFGALLREGRNSNLRAMSVALSPGKLFNAVAKPTEPLSYEEASNLRVSLQARIADLGITDEKGNPLRVNLSDALMSPLASALEPQFQGYYRPHVEALASLQPAPKLTF